ncbi:endolytic transglycosylase MltG, partial [Sphingomonas bacterium]|uniref:endolytic transglycosylase MltG n=1 Tax=Sphingomonas bacterium TaxID=1895847 RepID=UPI001576F62D
MRRLGCVALLLVLAAVALIWAVNDWRGAGPSGKAIGFRVADGASLASTARALEKAGAIRSARRFRYGARFLGSDAALKAGEYRLPARASAAAILRLIQSG